MIGAAAFLAINFFGWVVLILAIPGFAWPIASLLTFPFAFIAGQLAEGLAVWRSRAKPRDAAVRGAVLALAVAVVATVTQFFGTLNIQAADWGYVTVFALLLVTTGGIMTVSSALAPTIFGELIDSIRARRRLRQRSHREDAATAVAGGIRMTHRSVWS